MLKRDIAVALCLRKLVIYFTAATATSHFRRRRWGRRWRVAFPGTTAEVRQLILPSVAAVVKGAREVVWPG